MLYKTINIPSQDEIVEELKDNFPLYFGKLDEIKPGFQGCNIPLIKKTCTKLSEFLKRKNLYERWRGAGMSILKENFVLPIHSDSYLPGRCYALNIPIINCQDSYTIWYNIIDSSKVIKKAYTSNGVLVVSEHYEKNNTTEIERICSDSIMFVNVKTPHSGINLNNQTRAVLSLRFIPELSLEEIELFN